MRTKTDLCRAFAFANTLACRHARRRSDGARRCGVREAAVARAATVASAMPCAARYRCADGRTDADRLRAAIRIERDRDYLRKTLDRLRVQYERVRFRCGAQTLPP
jgi:hypothetical protein